MYYKNIDLEFKQGDVEGEFTAVFSTFNVIDHDGDVTLPGAFKEGQEVKIASWGHKWHELPVGKGVVRADEEKAWVEGRFFLDTMSGKETYLTVRNLGKLQEWSYGFDILEYDRGEFNGQQVRFLKALDVFEVSPVLRGAGIGTETVAIKDLKPYPNEHACRLRDPGDFQPDSFKRVTRTHEGKKYSVIMGRLKGETTMTEQAYRYDKNVWTVAQARAHCKSHDGILFEPAKGIPFVEHAEHALVTCKAFAVRARELAALRQKDGRTLSAEGAERVKSILREIEQIQRDLEKALEEPVDADKVMALYLRSQQVLTRT